MPIGIGTGIAVAGGLGAAATGIGSYFSSQAQQNAAQQGIAAQQGMYNNSVSLNSPFINAGKDAWSILSPMLGIGGPGIVGGGATGPGNGPGATDIYGNAVQQGFGTLTNPFQPTQQQLEQTPGYQFALSQGEKGVTNSNAAKGLGSSGAALKGAADYAQGLASNTFQQQQTNYLGQEQQIYNMLYGPTQQGAQSAASLGQQGVSTGQGIANSYGYLGNAQAAGINGVAGSVAGIGNSAASGLLYGSILGNSAGSAANGGLGTNPNNAFYGSNPFTGNGAGGINPAYAGQGNYFNPFSYSP